MIVDKATFHAALKAVLPVTRGNKNFPILTHVVLVREDGNRLVLRGSNLDQEINVAISADIDADFEDVAVPAATLTQFVDNAPGSEISLAIGRTGKEVTSVTIVSGKAKLRLFTLPADSFPLLESGPLEHGFTIDGQIFAKALKAVIYAAEDEKVRDYLKGALIEPEADGLVVVATDGHRLERRLIPKLAFDDDTVLAAIPRTILPIDCVNRLLNLVVEGRDLTLQFSLTKIRAVVGNVTMVSKLLEATYPDYMRVVPSDGDRRATFAAADLDSALGRVMLAQQGKEKGVLLRFSQGMLSLVARDQTGSDGQDEIAATCDTEIAIGFNGEYAREMLKHIGAERIEILMADHATAAKFRGAGDLENYAILMPMRVEGSQS